MKAQDRLSVRAEPPWIGRIRSSLPTSTFLSRSCGHFQLLLKLALGLATLRLRFD
jgi:hypothetical protein